VRAFYWHILESVLSSFQLRDINTKGDKQMFILRNKQQLAKAIDNAKALHPKVRMVEFGEYQVSGVVLQKVSAYTRCSTSTRNYALHVASKIIFATLPSRSWAAPSRLILSG